MTSFSNPQPPFPQGQLLWPVAGSFWRILCTYFPTEVLLYTPCLVLWIVQLTTVHQGAHCISLFWSTLGFFHICVIVHVWINPFPFWGTVRLFLASFTVYKAILNMGLHGSLCTWATVPLGKASYTGGFWVPNMMGIAHLCTRCLTRSLSCSGWCFPTPLRTLCS